MSDSPLLTREFLLRYFLQAATPPADWRIGMELEKMGRDAASGEPLPYDGDPPSVRKVLERLLKLRGGVPILEADNLIGVDGEWGTMSLEPGGQVEWSSRPQSTLDDLGDALNDHLEAMRRCSVELQVRWLPESVDPVLPLERMPWMPKARYNIMRPFLTERGRLAPRMMTQTASIQCAYDYADPEDWRRKFRAAALMTPIATALFANSRRIDDADTGYRSYRQAIWRETDPERCGLPRRLFVTDFELEAWLDYVLDVPTIFLHRARGLIPAGAVPFRKLLERGGCTALKLEDWETHLSTVFTDVRCYTYIEVRCADLQPDDLALAVPAFWTGMLYHPAALDAAVDIGRGIAGHEGWSAAMEAASRHGMEGRIGRSSIGELAAEALAVAARGLRDGATCSGGSGVGEEALGRLAERHRLRGVA